MRSTLSTLLLLLLTPLISASTPYPQSPKRGLVAVDTNNPQDGQLFVQPNNGLSWYYNYRIFPTSDYANLSQSTIEFVPMLWGASNLTGTTFLQNVTSLIKEGRNITHVLSFNEPDVNYTSSGSQVSPDLAAIVWIDNFDPLRKMGVKVGAPVVYADESGFTWLDKFYAACGKRNSTCAADFASLHVFGDMTFVQTYLAEYKKKYPSLPLWLTEYALPYSSVPATESFFNASIALFDSDPSIQRYSYFGAFRAGASNVGWNATMLDGRGRLTDLGSWYLGGAAVANASTTDSAAAAATSSKKSGAGGSRREMVGGGGFSVAAVVVMGLLMC